jgi:LacI family transcriptional regulator
MPILRKRVAAFVLWKFIFGQRVISGILDYAQVHSDWDVTIFSGGDLDQITSNPESFHGIIADPDDVESRELLRSSKIPAVAIANTTDSHRLPAVHSDEDEIGRMAARHLLDLGVQNFAFCGIQGRHFSKLRRAAFLRTLADEGIAERVYEHQLPARPPTATKLRHLSEWLRTLPRPTGLFCVSDFTALGVIQALRQTDIDVPNDLAIIGVDNEPAIEQVYRFPLTSIEQNLEVIGWEAASLLDRMIGGEDVGTDSLVIPPQRIVERRSTDLIAIEDEIVAGAMRKIRANACRRFNIEQLLEDVPLSLSALERRFKKQLGRSPQAELMRIRLERAKDLLLATNLSMQEIAEEIGYDEQRKLTILLKTKLGMSPSAFRKEHRRAYANIRHTGLV